MRRNAILAGLSLIVASMVLGATVFSEQVAQAAQAILPVVVTNDATRPVPVREQGTVAVRNVNEAAQPFKRRIDIAWLAGARNTSTEYVQVPAGKRLVIEQLSGAAVTDTGDEVLFLVGIRDGGGTSSQAYFETVRSPSTFFGAFHDTYTFTEQVRMYADGGSYVDVNAVRALQAVMNAASGWLFVSGYLVDMP